MGNSLQFLILFRHGHPKGLSGRICSLQEKALSSLPWHGRHRPGAGTLESSFLLLPSILIWTENRPNPAGIWTAFCPCLSSSHRWWEANGVEIQAAWSLHCPGNLFCRSRADFTLPDHDKCACLKTKQKQRAEQTNIVYAFLLVSTLLLT